MSCKHYYTPVCLVCVHLASGKPLAWYPIPSEGAENYDWLCRNCIQGGCQSVTCDSLVTLCLNCVREKQQAATVVDATTDHLDWLVLQGFLSCNITRDGQHRQQ